MSTLWMVANAVEGDAPLLRVGQPVRARVTAYPDRAFDGQITIVGPQVDLTTRRFFVRSEIKDPEGLLRPGMFGSFTIDIGTPQPSLAVPTAAVVREGDGSMSVWQTDGSRRFERRIVKIGLQQNGMTQILEGLSAGDSVVTEGAVYVSNKAFGGSTGD
jgi:cobalt-zinc-cadmium efflux system membrane fusion protein